MKSARLQSSNAGRCFRNQKIQSALRSSQSGCLSFGKPEVGAAIAELLRAPHKTKPLKKGVGYEIDKNQMHKNYEMLIAEYLDKSKSWRLSVLSEWFPRYMQKAIEQILD